jgi:hypothetical protein
MGRFMSPDWSAKEEPVPYAKVDDQRPYLKQFNTGAGGPANSPNPQRSYSIIITE